MVTNPNFKNGVGRLTTDRFDFQKHIDGTDFQHHASGIVASPGIEGATDVQGSLNNIAAFIAAGSAVGQGFITVGDGYNTWHNADGNNNFDPAIPALDTLLNPIFSAIYNNTALPPGYDRIKFGGIVVIKAGTYIIRDTINVPPGITILGEGFGTKIINATALTLHTPPTETPVVSYAVTSATTTSPIVLTVTGLVGNLVNGQSVNVNNVGGNTAANGSWIIGNLTFGVSTTSFSLTGSTGTIAYTSGGVVNTCRPLFKILTDFNRSTNDAAVDPTYFMFSRETKIMNLVIGDNFVDPPFLGSIQYKTPQNSTTTTVNQATQPLIKQESGSSLVMDSVTMVGRVNFSGANVIQVTSAAVLLDNTFGALNGTILKVNNCFIDGFQYPVSFQSLGGSSDYLEVSNSKIRGYGMGVTISGFSAILAALFMTNDGNTKIINNTLYADAFFPASPPTIAEQGIILINSRIASPPTVQGKSKIILAGNNLNVEKSRNSSVPINTTNGLYYIFQGLSVLGTYATSLVYGNTFQDSFEVIVDGLLPPFTVDSSNFVNGSDAHFINTLTVDGATTFNGNFNIGNNSVVTIKGVQELNVKHISSASYTVDTNQSTLGYDSLLLVDRTVTSSVTITLPSAASYPGRVLRIKDTGHASGSNFINVNGSGGQLVDGSSGVTLNTPYKSVTLVADATGSAWYTL